MADTLTAIKVVAEGQVTSFRYPHFKQGVHPTYDMPPPATIYGHMCSAYGDWIDPLAVRFGYHFCYEGRFTDYEHLHFREKDGSTKLAPMNRDLLFNPRLTLYVVAEDWNLLKRLQAAFRSPRYAVALGRSQDLMMYVPASNQHSIAHEVTLTRADSAYFDGTLLNLADAALLGGGYTTVTMPRFINDLRHADPAQYAMIKRPAIYPLQESDEITLSGEIDFWVDESEHSWNRYPELPRAVIFHSFVEA